MKLVLFDIDGTILWTDGAGRRSMEAAMHEVFGHHGDPTYRYDGKTDRQIAREQMRWAGVDDAMINSRMDDLFAAYLARLDVELVRDAAASHVCAGIPALLDELEAHERATLGLLTGNTEHGARKKLNAVGVNFDRFHVNAFGSDHEDRPALPAVAQRRAQEFFGTDMPGDQMVIIGDTPADIECGRSIGVRAIAVATGRFSVEELAAHHPAAVFATLEDTAAVLAAILD